MNRIGRRTTVAGLLGLFVSPAYSAGERRPVSLRAFGAVGDGVADDSPAWNEFIEAAAETGEGFVPAGHYRLNHPTRFSPSGAGVRLLGAGSDKVLLDATHSPRATLFALVDAPLHISGLSTRNLMLVEAHETMTASISALAIHDWKWTNDAAAGVRALSIFTPYETHPYRIDDVTISSVSGSGGVCGLWLRTAMRSCRINAVDIRNIHVPDSGNWYYQSRPDRMNAIGTACAIHIGDDRADAQRQFERCEIGTVLVDGVRDDRRLKGNEETAANCDGVRILARNVEFDNVTIRNVSNHSRRDCTGLYAKVVGLKGKTLTIENAGHHEASMTLKGTGRSRSSSGARGGKVRLDRVMISNTQGFVGRPAVYLRCEDVAIKDMEIVGCGGDVEDPYAPGKRISGASAVVRMSPPLGGQAAMGDVRLDRLVMRDCVLGGLWERWAVGLGAYRRIRLGEVVCDGLSNAGRFAHQSAAYGQDIAVLAFAESMVGCDVLEIGRVVARNCHAPGRMARVLHLMGRAPLREVRLGPIDSDLTFDETVKISGDEPIGAFAWRADCFRPTIRIETAPLRSTTLPSSNNDC
ncbi:MAG: glycosyl hydrolase family 28-related protein [Pseudomonadota bacterium]